MQVSIRHLTGPLSGTEQSVEAQEEILFGRDREVADVVFPADCAAVSRQHFRLVRYRNGPWRVDLFGDKYVEVDGRPAVQNQELRGTHLVRLGRTDGPTFEVTISPESARRSLVKTATQYIPPSWREHYTLLRNATALAVALLMAGGVWIYLASRSDREELAAIVERFQEEIAAAAKTEFQDRDIQNLRDATYLLLVRDRAGTETPVGTGWAAGPNVLVTNAHVVDALENRFKGQTAIARARPEDSGVRDFIVESTSQHPGWKEFRAFVRNLGSSLTSEFKALNLVSAYDIGEIVVSGSLPHWLDTAAPTEVETLKPGQRIAYAGYPLENLAGGESAMKRPEPQVHYGNITSVTDYFMLSADAGHRLLVQHNLPFAGGASGSAVINTDGRVIGIVSGANVVRLGGERGPGSIENTDVERTPSAALINYAQRIDVLATLDQNAEGFMQKQRTYWDQRSQLFDRFFEHVEAQFLREAEPAGVSGDRELILEEEQTLEPGPSATSRQHVEWRHAVPAEAGWQYGFMVYSETDERLGLRVDVDGAPAAVHDGIEAARAVVVPTTKAADLEVRVWALVNHPTAFVLRGYRWRLPAEPVATGRSAAQLQ